MIYSNRCPHFSAHTYGCTCNLLVYPLCTFLCCIINITPSVLLLVFAPPCVIMQKMAQCALAQTRLNTVVWLKL